ncbi:response regulator transcription factor [Litoribrevibacter euphylliae]|uniref:Response regulator transcription factor n=1 Tax=Litoribrevibacter euphylliae TaxID=1834034 RepID=A0ABV7HCH0_9GAMM
MKILVVEDDKTTREFLQQALTEQGYLVEVAADGQDGLFQAMELEFDLIILDRMLPKMDGLTVLQALRSSERSVPVLILSALDSVDERVKGLKQGGDDYLVKPFALAELLARVEILIRRNDVSSSAQQVTELVLKNLKLDLLSHKLVVQDDEIELQPKEFQLLKYLLEHQNQVVTRTMLFEAVWNYQFDPQTNVIDVHVARLRKKLAAAGCVVEIDTVRGVGYRLSSD